MEYWEFLLQQEGDSNWLPLDTSQMEILEGRYRIMAHCSQPNTPVDICISQRLTDQMPPKRRSLKRQGQTSENGLMVVLPFTRLTAGSWDILCQAIQGGDAPGDGNGSDADSETPKNAAPWHYAIQLQVLPQGVGDDGDWFADDGSASPAAGMATAGELQNLESSESSEASPPVTPTPPAWPNLDLQQVAASLDQAHSPVMEPGQETESLYTLALEQTALMASHGQPLQLAGYANGVVDGESCSDMALVVRLSNPQSAEVLALTPFALASSALPSPFAINLSLPDFLSTRLLLGELALVSCQAGAVSLLALQRFTVTVDLAALFDEIANRAEANADNDIVFAPDKLLDHLQGQGQRDADPDETSDLWADIDFKSAPPRSVPSITLPRSNPSIPPKIYYPSPHEATAHTPVLPPLGKPKVSPIAQGGGATANSDAPDTEGEAAAEQADTQVPPKASVPQPSAQDSRSTPAGPQGINLPSFKAAKKVPGAAAGDASVLPPQSAGQPPGAPIKDEALMLPSHETMAFKALNLQERFWNRLNDLAITIQQEAQATRQGEPAIDPLVEGDETAEAQHFVPFEGEVVIYEDAETAADELSPEQAAALVSNLEQQDAEEVVTPPVPEIEMPGGELTAGESVLLTLRVPFHPNRLYLKVWITDPQTRSLADEPRQITHLAPNGLGQLEGSIQLTVPMGILEAWFEAIAVDMVTQQESYKASVIRSINPLGVDAPSLEEFDL